MCLALLFVESCIKWDSLERKYKPLLCNDLLFIGRGHFMSLVLQFSPEYFVWVDETGSDARSHIRKFGYQLRGLTPVHHRIVVRRKRISAISAISTDGIMGLHLTQGNVNSEIFCDFLTSLIPEMEAFDGSPKKSIIIMDNCSIHHICSSELATKCRYSRFLFATI